jgi:hypothetical protein
MALNRYLYPQKGTNIVQECSLSTRVGITAAGAIDTAVAQVGRGITVTPSGAGVNAIYTVTIDNSTVSEIVNCQAMFVAAFDKAKHTNITVKEILAGKNGVVLQAWDNQTGSVAPIDAAGLLCVTLICTLSSVPA